MPRRAAATKRPVEADPVHRSKLVQQVINRVMLDGKVTYQPVAEATGQRYVELFGVLGEASGVGASR